MELNVRTADWSVVEDALIETFDQMIRPKMADRVQIYTLMKAAWLEKCEEIYKRMRSKRK